MDFLKSYEEMDGVQWVTEGRLKVMVGEEEAAKAIKGAWYKTRSCPKRGTLYGYIVEEEQSKANEEHTLTQHFGNDFWKDTQKEAPTHGKFPLQLLAFPKETFQVKAALVHDSCKPS